jgi:hypothetical protein
MLKQGETTKVTEHFAILSSLAGLCWQNKFQCLSIMHNVWLACYSATALCTLVLGPFTVKYDEEHTIATYQTCSIWHLKLSLGDVPSFTTNQHLIHES